MRARDYEAEEDLRLLQRLAAECWRLEGPDVYITVGDIAWQMYQHLNKLDEARIRLWLDDDGEPLAWGWLRLPARLVLLTHPERRPLLVAAVLDWFETAAEPGALAVEVLEADRTTADVVERRGYRLSGERSFSHLVCDLSSPIPEPVVPHGYRIRPVRDREDVPRRVAVHRSAFAPSRVVEASYRRLMREPPYCADLDFVVEDADGTFASFCLGWLDAANRLGELEPVGTHPDHRRRGLARAVCLAALAGLRSAGAETGLVYAVEGSPAQRLYESIGFTLRSRHLEYRR